MNGNPFAGESQNLEFKREIPKKHENLLKDIIAFANCAGGKVIIGIEDVTNKVYGIGDVNPFRLSDDISSMISDACVPQIETDISAQTWRGKTLLVIDVVPGKFRPYYLKAAGKEKSTFIRVNGTSRAADSTRLKELELEGQRVYYDMLREIGMDFDESEAWRLCGNMKRVALSACKSKEERNQIPDVTLSKLENMGILRLSGRSYVPTHAFNLLTVNSMKHAKIQCALFKGTDRSEFIDRKEFRGPIYEQIEDAYRFVLRHIDMRTEINGIVRRDMYELPLQAIREAIVNGVTHRSYVDDSCMQVSIYDDRVEIYSPGGLYGGLDIESALAGKSKCRNAAISEAFHYMKIIEAWGTGLNRIFASCRKFGLKEPAIGEFGGGFRVVFFRQTDEAFKEKYKISDSETEHKRAERKKEGSNIEKVCSAEEKEGSNIKKVSSAKEKEGSNAEKISSAWARQRGSAFAEYKTALRTAGITRIFIENIETIYDRSAHRVFKQSDIMEYLSCSKSKAGNLIKTMKQTNIIRKVTGMGNGRYQFIEKDT